jgi:hypothetical protein
MGWVTELPELFLLGVVAIGFAIAIAIHKL